MTRRPNRSPGVTTWQARRDLERTRRRQLIPVLLLAALAVLWCTFLFDVGTDSDAVTGWVFLEIVTLVPLVFGARRVVRVSALIARADAYSEEDQATEISALRSTDESIWRVGMLVASLDKGPARKAAEEALAAAARAANLLRPLVRRRTQLEHLVDVSRSRSATATLQTTLDACSDDVDRLQATIETLAASVASLVDAATDDSFERELTAVRSSTDDVLALVAAFRDIEAIEQSARGTSTAPGLTRHDLDPHT